MKKIIVLIIVLIIATTLIACSRETVTLSCDAEGCNNVIEKKVKKDDAVDNDWIVYCEECAEKLLSDE